MNAAAGDELLLAPVARVAELLARREVSPLDLVDRALARIEANAHLGAFWTLQADAARAAARAAEAELRSGPRSPLHGIPIAHKDLYDTAGVRTTAGASFFAERVPKRDAAVVERLARAGAISLGKLAMHELAAGVTTQNPHYGRARNPWDPTRIPGGSSGGSAAALAAGLCFVATGTDTGGSIRIPAALCGLVGIKPTYGLVSRRGVVPLAWSLDHAGPLARRVEDAALALEAMAGFDPHDPGSADRIVPRLAEAARRPEAKGVRVGLLRDFSFERCAAPVREAGRDVARRLERMGARVEELPAPGLELAYAAYFPIFASEFAAALADARRRHPPEAFGADVRLQLALGEAVLAVRYLRAQRLRARVQRLLGALFSRVDVVLTATTAVTAPKIDAEQVEIEGEAVSVLEALVRFNMPWNLTGLPAVTLPAARDDAGLPVGVQLVGAPFAERALLRVAAALEADLSFC